ncbi:O-acetylserine/cysteine exporter [Pusillimonas caeni]|uniref:EamA family transporter n=1 Tax=Pusillimonas caeni TaxID=1348472 RepID=UPI000E5993CB|nr:EamA family transporter [Pusillimonas caeni]TFL14480.1 O-acetylserine/cysteine exporter [Pusillimonas caeni]
MPLRDWVAALAIILAWGVNFVVIKWGLDEIPPFLLGGLRFVLVALAAFFIPRPAVSWRVLLLLGMTLSFGQFAFLFTAMTVGMSAGLASLVLQSQVFFTVLLAAVVLGERIRPHHLLGMMVAAVGLALIEHGAIGGNVTLLGFVLTLAAALSWACGNIVVKYVGKVDMLSLVIWGALIPPIPFFIMSWLFEGPAVIRSTFESMTWKGVGALFYLALMATTLGFVLWARLLARHPVSKVAPLSLLVPIVGLLSAAILLGEQLHPLQWAGGLIVLAGLSVNLLGPRMLKALRALR